MAIKRQDFRIPPPLYYSVKNVHIFLYINYNIISHFDNNKYYFFYLQLLKTHNININQKSRERDVAPW